MSSSDVSATDHSSETRGEAGQLHTRYTNVCDRVAQAAKRSGRRAQDIIVVAVTKNAELEQIRQLIQMGHRDFGEHRAQYLVQRASMVAEYLGRQRRFPTARSFQTDDTGSLLFTPGSTSELDPKGLQPGGREGIRWHMIEPLQRNKARKILEFTRLNHAVDSLRLAEEIQSAAMRRDQIVEVLLHINCTGEESKFGCAVPAAVALAEQIDSMVSIKLRGAMTMTAPGIVGEAARLTFVRCRELFREIQSVVRDSKDFNILSMGTSENFEVAIEEGANIVRIGSLIFGHAAPTEPELPELPEPDEPEDELAYGS